MWFEFRCDVLSVIGHSSAKMIFYKEESYKIIGAAMKVYNNLGPGFLEAVYQEALEIELSRVRIPFEREKEIPVYYDGVKLHQAFRADFICCDDVIIELKAVSALADSHRAQVYNYLKATKVKLGILINFGNPDGLEWERKVI